MFFTILSMSIVVWHLSKSIQMSAALKNLLCKHLFIMINDTNVIK